MPNHDWMRSDDTPTQRRPAYQPIAPKARAVRADRLTAIELALIAVTGIAGFWCAIEALIYMAG
ncbi:MAG: hypothetical protein U1E50_08410 [Caulobacteraceae bacterium]